MRDMPPPIIQIKESRKNVENLHGLILDLKSKNRSHPLSSESLDRPPIQQSQDRLDQHIGNNSNKDYSNTIRLEKVIGSGTYAVVYRAVTPKPLLPHVAVKCVSTKNMTKSQRKRQIQEFQILKELNESTFSHRIVKLLHEQDDSEITFLIFKLAQTNLFNYLVGINYPTLGEADMDVEEVNRLFLELLDGLGGCHELGIFHRDIKPENLLLDREGKTHSFHIKIADFGLATRMPESTEFGCGSLRYMSRECYNHDHSEQKYDCAKNDVWSSAIVLINMLTKKNPWNSPGPNDAYYRENVLEHPQNLLHGDKFQAVFDFSSEFCHVLRQVFRNESERVNIERFTRLICNLGLNFFSRDHISILPPANLTSVACVKT